MAAHYTFLATDLVTGTVLGELPINGVSLDCQLNQPGNMAIAGRLSDPRLMSDAFIANTTPGKTAFWAYRENQIVWGGIILTREYQSEGKSLQMTGQTFECYPGRRFPRSVLGTATQVFHLGQAATIDALWSQLQSISSGSISVLPANLPMVDPTTQLTVNGYDLSTSYLDLMTSVTKLQGGPDWTVTWTEDGFGKPLKQLVAATPIGNPIGATDLVVDYPGGVTKYLYNENASTGANSWWAVGDGDGATAAVGNAQDPNSLVSGYPLWESVNSYSGVTVQTTINNHATSDLATFPVPFVTHAGSLKGDAFPPFGSYGLGDYLQFNVTDPRFPGGFTFFVRAIGWSIQTPDNNQGTEQIDLVFDEPSANA